MPLVTSLKLDAKFNLISGSWGAMAGRNYNCEVTNIAVDSPDTAIESINGEHLSGKSNSDVLSFKIESSPNLLYMPSGAENFFKNLIGIFISDSGLVAITQNDLKPFSNLKELRLPQNKLTTLESGLFQFNPKLNRIVINGNQLNSISADIFEPLKDLTVAYFGTNVCVNINAIGDEEIAKVKEVIVEKCQN